MATLSALITVYHGNTPAHLSDALDSLAAQTRPADEIVIVQDGPVPEPIAQVVEDFVAAQPSARVVSSPVNRGAGPASQAGMDTITTDWVARLDADDKARPERFEQQLEFAATHPEVAVIGTAVEESSGAIRTLPAEHDKIANYAKLNSPVNNPSVMISTAAITDVGGYRDVHFMEDYDLYARLLAGGYRFANMPEPLTWFRVNDEQFGRRTQGMWAAERQMQRNLVSYGLISRPRAVLNLGVRMAYRALPDRALKRVYSTLFHKQGGSIKR